MTGTGTQADPYVVTAFAEFLEAVSIADVYVEVANDLDAAEEEFEYLTEAVAVNCTHVNGNGHTISNVTVQAANMIAVSTTSSNSNSSADYVRMENIKLINWMHIKTTADVGSICITNDSQSAFNFEFRNCEFSFGINGRNAYAQIIYYGSWHHAVFRHCSLHLTFMNPPSDTASTVSQLFDSAIFYNCNVVAEGRYLFGDTRPRFCRICELYDTGFVVHDFSILTSSAATAIYANYSDTYKAYAVLSNSYFVFDNVACNTSTLYAQYNYGKTSNFAFCVTGSPINPSGGGANFIFTKEQFQDEAYLRSVGWLP